MRPDNLVGGMEAVRERLVSLGLGPAGPVCVLDQLDGEWEGVARSLWQADGLVAWGYPLRDRVHGQA